MSLTIFGELADRYDAQVEEAIEALDSWVESTDYNWVAAGTAAGAQAFMRFSQSFVDVLRLGEGTIEEAPEAISQEDYAAAAWGVAEDVLRLLIVAGPIVRLSARGVRLIRATQAEGTMVCSWVAHTQAIRLSGQRFFITMRTLLRQAGLTEAQIQAAGGTSRQAFRKLMTALQRLRIRFSQPSHPPDLEGLFEMIRRSPRNVFTFSISGSGGGHRLSATFANGAVTVLDTNGRVFQGLRAFRRAYRGVELGSYPILRFPNAVMLNVYQAGIAAGHASGIAAGVQMATANDTPDIAFEVIPPRWVDARGQTTVRGVPDWGCLDWGCTRLTGGSTVDAPAGVFPTTGERGLRPYEEYFGRAGSHEDRPVRRLTNTHRPSPRAIGIRRSGW
ncbi:MAG: hypothetical protein L0215_14430 [Gemmataceae bacterium]|nr:hypothetical protein [Gemmataceae bacterium]